MSQPIAHRELAVLRVSDARVLDEIRAVVALDTFVLAVVSPTELILDPARVGQLASQLAAKGISPLMKRAHKGMIPKDEGLRVQIVEEPTESLAPFLFDEDEGSTDSY